MWESIIGHETNKTFLENMLKGARKTPSLLFCGPEGIGKKKMARAFAKSFLCLEDLVPCTCRSRQAMDSDSHRISSRWSQGAKAGPSGWRPSISWRPVRLRARIVPVQGVSHR